MFNAVSRFTQLCKNKIMGGWLSGEVLYKHKDLSSDPSTHIQTWAWFVTPALGNRDRQNPGLTSQPA